MTRALNLIYASLRDALAKELSLAFGERLPERENLIEPLPRSRIGGFVPGAKIRRSLVNGIDGEYLSTNCSVIGMFHHSRDCSDYVFGCNRPQI